jgi:hypothetical protein
MRFISFSLSRLWLLPSMPLKHIRLPRLTRLLPFIEFLTWIDVRNSNLAWAWKCISSDEYDIFRKQNEIKTCSSESTWLNPQ